MTTLFLFPMWNCFFSDPLLYQNKISQWTCMTTFCFKHHTTKTYVTRCGSFEIDRPGGYTQTHWGWSCIYWNIWWFFYVSHISFFIFCQFTWHSRHITPTFWKCVMHFMFYEISKFELLGNFPNWKFTDYMVIRPLLLVQVLVCRL